LQAYKIVESNVKKAVKNAKKQFGKKLAKDSKKILELSISILTEKRAIKVPLKVNDVFLDEDQDISKNLNDFLVVFLQQKIY